MFSSPKWVHPSASICSERLSITSSSKSPSSIIHHSIIHPSMAITGDTASCHRQKSYSISKKNMMMLWYGDTFCITGPLQGESTGGFTRGQLCVFVLFDASLMLLKEQSSCQWFQIPWCTKMMSMSWSTLIVLCCVYIQDDFTHIHQGCFTGTGAIIWLPQC